MDSLHVRDGAVLAPDGRVLSYAELVAAEPLAGPLPEPFTLVAASIPEATPFRPEARAIVTGAARYAADVRLPGLLHGHVLHPPRPGSRLRMLDATAARALPGVLAVVVDGDFVGVVAQHDAQALAAAQMMTAQWDAPPIAGAPFEAALRDDAGTDAALAAARRVTAHYHVPPIAHATVCPSAAVADVRADRTDLYVATQRPFGLRDEVAGLLGPSPAQVRVHPQLMSGQFGRGNVGDAALDAVRLSRAVARPVRVQWTRPEEFAFRPDGPNVWHDVRRLSARRRTAGAHAVRSERWIDVRSALNAETRAGLLSSNSEGRFGVAPRPARVASTPDLKRPGCARI